MILADVVKRWEVLKGERPALLCTGTDEHGMKVQQAAEAQELHPKALCDANSEIFRDLARKANIANDHFIRTTDPEHREAVEHFWRRLDENGYIYETKHEGWYCVSDETFYPENMVAKTVDPRTGKTFMASTETGNAVEWTEEKNYHFRMTALRDRLLEFYKQNPQWVRPENRMREVVDWVENNLEDLSISRPASRLQWGIPVPDDPSQTIYVWVDALINYLTYAKYPYWAPGASHLGGWPADVHVIGKDIVRFHCVYWPALLMALDLPLPKRVISHGHWLMDSKKMSKSIGNVVNPFFAMSRWGVDTMRYFLMYNGAIESDSNYNNDLIVERYKKGLQGGLGNLLSRMTLSKKWDVREAIQAVHEDHGLKLPIEDFPEVATLASDHQRLLEYLVELVSQDLDECAPKIALHRIMECVFEVSHPPYRPRQTGPLTRLSADKSVRCRHPALESGQEGGRPPRRTPQRRISRRRVPAYSGHPSPAFHSAEGRRTPRHSRCRPGIQVTEACEAPCGCELRQVNSSREQSVSSPRLGALIAIRGRGKINVTAM